MLNVGLAGLDLSLMERRLLYRSLLVLRQNKSSLCQGRQGSSSRSIVGEDSELAAPQNACPSGQRVASGLGSSDLGSPTSNDDPLNGPLSTQATAAVSTNAASSTDPSPNFLTSAFYHLNL